jgi:hypothetical protein
MPKKAKPNKSQAVREYLQKNPGAQNKEIAEALAKEGIKITADYVSIIKSNTKKRRRRRRKAAEVLSVKSGVGVADIKAAFMLLKHCGGIKGAKEALAAAQEIQKVL